MSRANVLWFLLVALVWGSSFLFIALAIVANILPFRGCGGGDSRRRGGRGPPGCGPEAATLPDPPVRRCSATSRSARPLCKAAVEYPVALS